MATPKISKQIQAKKLPFEIVEQRGTTKKNPQKYKKPPKNDRPLPPAPRWMNEWEKKAYKEVVDLCIPGIVTASDAPVVWLMALRVAEMKQKRASFNKTGDLKWCIQRLGLSPVDRANLAPLRDDKPAAENPFLSLDVKLDS